MTSEEKAAAAMYTYLLLDRLGGSAHFSLDDMVAAKADVRGVGVYQDGDGLFMVLEKEAGV